MTLNSLQLKEAYEVAQNKLETVSHTSSNVVFYTTCQEIVKIIKDLHPSEPTKEVTDEWIATIIDQTVTEENVDKVLFAKLLIDMILNGLSKDQKVAIFMKNLDEQRYFCQCDRLDWDAIKLSILDLINDITPS